MLTLFLVEVFTGVGVRIVEGMFCFGELFFLGFEDRLESG